MYTKTRKRVALVLLGLIAVSSTLVAQQYSFKVGQLYYEITDATKREVAVRPEIKCQKNHRENYHNYTNYTDENRPTGAITIPTTVVYEGDNYSVKSIGDDAFSGCTGLTSINIPNGITSIGEYAFSRCSGLTSIIIPSGIKIIGAGTFSYCTGLTSINIPEGVTGIMSRWYPIGEGQYVSFDGVFEGCSGLTSIIIPNSVDSIGYATFSGCTGLTSINIPNSVTSIGEKAFSGCSALTSINIPSGIKIIGSGTFSYCTGLTSITIPEGVTKITNSGYHNGAYFSFFYGAFEGCTSLTSINLPNSIISIGEKAFSGCRALTSITIPSSVTEIRNDAFYNCTSLASVTLKNGINSIGSYNSQEWGDREYKGVFEGCISLTSISIPNSVKSIGKYTFSGCSGLNSVTVHWQRPLIIDRVVFDRVTLNRVKLTVPQGTASLYQSAYVWKDFNPMVEQLVNYTITYNQSTNGTFKVKNGTQEVASGSSLQEDTELTIEATPDPFYRLDSIKVNGVRIEGFSFRLGDNTTLEVFFGRDAYKVTYEQSTGGTFRILNGTQEIASGSLVDKGTVLTVEATPNAGKKFDFIKINYKNIAGNSFKVRVDTKVEVFFGEVNKSTITYNRSEGGTFRILNGTQEVASDSVVDDGTVLTVEATPDQSRMYERLDSIKVNGERIVGLSFTVTHSSHIEVFFGRKKFAITYSQPVGGTISLYDYKRYNKEVHSGDSLEYDSWLMFKLTPAPEYKYDSLTVNGRKVDIAIDGTRGLIVSYHMNIKAFFSKPHYAVTYNNPYGGSIHVIKGTDIVMSGEKVEKDTELTVRATPNSGFALKSLTLNGQDIDNGYTFRIDKAVDIRVVFSPATALDEATTESLTLYPNPVADVLYLSATARTIRIYDMYGTEVAHATNTDKVEVSHLPAGVYTVKADGTVAKMVKR